MPEFSSELSKRKIEWHEKLASDFESMIIWSDNQF